MKKNVFASVLFVFFLTPVFAQQLQHPGAISANSNTMVTRNPDSRGWTDPALQHNRLLQNQVGSGTLVQVGNFKVKGSPFLYGQRHAGDVFSEKEKAWNIYISYNTYNQELEFYSTSNPDQPLVKEAGELDSFIIHKDVKAGIEKELKFVYGSLIGSNDKSYYQEVCGGDKIVFYKKYKSEIGIVPDNIAQPDLRQFELDYDYYYYNKNTKKLKKLKQNPEMINKEFNSVLQVGQAVSPEIYYVNQEDAICNGVRLMNETKKAF
jgi:hypothetical protein